jgi:transcriptional regulator with XRE-family HTH domain
MGDAADHALQALREYVARTGSARKAAWATGVGPERISRWFHGKEPFSPTLATLEKMANALGMSVAALLGGADAAPSSEGRLRLNAVTITKGRDGMMRLGAVKRHLEAPTGWLDAVGPHLNEPGRLWVVEVGPEPPKDMGRVTPAGSMLVVDRGPEAAGIDTASLHQGAICILSFEGGFRMLRTWWDEKERMLVYSGDNPTQPSTAHLVPSGDTRPMIWGQVVRISIDALPKSQTRPQLVRVVE